VRTADVMPAAMRKALVELLGEEVEDVDLLEHSAYARMHVGARATTRRNRILLAGSAMDFFADPEFVLHEYYHVLRQWNRGRMSVASYVLEWLKRGYFHNRYERQARRFARLRRPTFEALLRNRS